MTPPPEELIEEKANVERRQRLYFEVPNPRAWFCLGQPDARGYRGVSLGAADNLFVSVKGQAFHQAVGSVQHVTLDAWYQASTGDSVINSGESATVTAKKQIVVVAGAGYPPDVQLELGDSPPTGYFNPLDYQEILNPCRDGVRAYDTAFIGKNDDLRELIGYRVNPAAAATAAAAGLQAKILKKLFGTPAPPTENSESIEQFARQYTGLYGQLARLKRLTDRVERWTSRPDALPGGKAFELLGDLGNAVKLLTSACAESMPVRKGGFLEDHDFKGEVALQSKDAEIARGEGAGHWTQSANAVVALSTVGLRHIMRPIANRIRVVSSALQAARGLLDTLAEAVGLNRKTSALALVGKDGVSIVSPRRVFAYAADGFYFVTSEPGDPVEDALDRAAKWLQKGADALGLGVPTLPDPVPGFTVRSAGDIEMSSEGGVYTSVLGTHARMQMMSGGVAEFGAVDDAALTARRGTAEVLGKKVVVGAPVKRAKAAATKAMALAPATATADAAAAALLPLRRTYLDLVTQKTADEKELHRLTNLIYSDPVGQSRKLAPEKYKAYVKVMGAAAPIKTAKVALQVAEINLQTATELRNQIEGAAEAESAVAAGLGWKASKQSLADSVEIGAASSVEVFSANKVAIGAAEKIELVCEAPPPLPAIHTMKITMGNEIEISGGSFGMVATIRVTSTAVTIKVQETEINCTGTSLELKAGPSKITLGPAGIEITGVKITLDGAMVNNV